MTKLNYYGIKKMLDGNVFGAAISDDGKHVILQAERIGDEIVYTAAWESKRTERVAWYVKHWYHEDGTTEETFECEGL